jgi:hypothetical protein
MSGEQLVGIMPPVASVSGSSADIAAVLHAFPIDFVDSAIASLQGQIEILAGCGHPQNPPAGRNQLPSEREVAE